MLSPIAAVAQPIPQSGIDAATEWYARQGLRLEAFRNMPIAEAGKRLNQVVYGFCSSGSPSSPDINQLFHQCTTACGGYSYVLRGLLKAISAETRYANFYNIPNQGNHTAVEVKLEYRIWGWRLLY